VAVRSDNAGEHYLSRDEWSSNEDRESVLVASVLVLALLCITCVTGRLQRGRYLYRPEDSRSSSDLFKVSSYLGGDGDASVLSPVFRQEKTDLTGVQC